MNNSAASEALQQESQSPSIDVSQCLKNYDDHLTRVQDLAPRTRQGYCFWVKRFLVRFSALDAPNWASLRAEHVTMFVQQEASRLHRYARAIPGTAIRAFLRYLTFLAAICSGLEAAVPQMPRWKHTELPRYLPSADVERVVDCVLDGSTTGLRNHAILLLLARTGLRADEVSKLSLNDIDWVTSTIRIPSTKSHRERHRSSRSSPGGSTAMPSTGSMPPTIGGSCWDAFKRGFMYLRKRERTHAHFTHCRARTAERSGDLADSAAFCKPPPDLRKPIAFSPS